MKFIFFPNFHSSLKLTFFPYSHSSSPTLELNSPVSSRLYSKPLKALLKGPIDVPATRPQKIAFLLVMNNDPKLRKQSKGKLDRQMIINRIAGKHYRLVKNKQREFKSYQKKDRKNAKTTKKIEKKKEKKYRKYMYKPDKYTPWWENV